MRWLSGPTRASSLYDKLTAIGICTSLECTKARIWNTKTNTTATRKQNLRMVNPPAFHNPCSSIAEDPETTAAGATRSLLYFRYLSRKRWFLLASPASTELPNKKSKRSSLTIQHLYTCIMRCIDLRARTSASRARDARFFSFLGAHRTIDLWTIERNIRCAPSKNIVSKRRKKSIIKSHHKFWCIIPCGAEFVRIKNSSQRQYLLCSGGHGKN